MSTPDDKRRRSPADRFRNIISADQSKAEVTGARRYSKHTTTPGLNLPAPMPRQEEAGEPSSLAPVRPTPTTYRTEGRSFLPAFWTAASVISLIFNVIMLVLLISLLQGLGSLNASAATSGILGGLYNNFERMDSAHIKTNIPIKTTIPLNLSIPVQATTGITLAQDASIPGAHVKINTPLFNIDAPANVTLPAGTSLDVAMSFTVPVQTEVPVTLKVPVDIPLQKTELHPALVGLQDTIRPLYCMVDPAAQSLNGKPVCK